MATTQTQPLPPDAWLAQVAEQPLEPELPIIDPHHHLWDHPNSRYMLDEILRDTETGHRVIATVFVECLSMYRADGPESLKPVGETEFVNGIAAQSASGQYGETRVAAGIVSFADLTLGAAVEEVLQAHIVASPARFRGIRHAGGFDPDPAVRNSHTRPTADLYQSARFREGFSRLKGFNLSFEAWQYHPQMRQVTDLARAFPDTTIILNHFGGPLGIGPYKDRRAEIFRQWKDDITDLAQCSNVVVKLGGINMPGMDSTGIGDPCHRIVMNWWPRLVITICTPSTGSDRDDVCSRATSRSTGFPARTECCGTHLRRLSRGSRRMRRPSYFVAPRRRPIASRFRQCSESLVNSGAETSMLAPIFSG
jgi:L-fuconolactonase